MLVLLHGDAIPAFLEDECESYLVLELKHKRGRWGCVQGFHKCPHSVPAIIRRWQGNFQEQDEEEGSQDHLPMKGRVQRAGKAFPVITERDNAE